MKHEEFMALFDERRKGISTLISIYNGPGKLMSAYTDKGHDSIRWKRILDLERYGLVEIDREPRKHNTKYVKLTAKGKNVAESFLEAIMCAAWEAKG